jgi:hypothetical protein
LFLADSKIEADNPKPPAKKNAGAPQAGEPTEMLIKHLRLNINAPGDKTDADANVWFGYPQKWRDNSKRKAFQSLPVTGLGATDGYHLNADAHAVANTDKPWLYTSGAIGPLDLVIHATNKRRTGSR